MSFAIRAAAESRIYCQTALLLKQGKEAVVEKTKRCMQWAGEGFDSLAANRLMRNAVKAVAFTGIGIYLGCTLFFRADPAVQNLALLVGLLALPILFVMHVRCDPQKIGERFAKELLAKGILNREMEDEKKRLVCARLIVLAAVAKLPRETAVRFLNVTGANGTRLDICPLKEWSASATASEQQLRYLALLLSTDREPVIDCLKQIYHLPETDKFLKFVDRWVKIANETK